LTDSSGLQPSRGEIWLINLDPTIGDEIKKKRPCIVINSDSIGKLHIRLVAPITEWKDAFLNNLWHVRIDPDKSNGLTKTSAIDVLQLRGVDMRRFDKKIGKVSAMQIEEIVAAIAAVIEFR